jgi:hypothetical protein
MILRAMLAVAYATGRASHARQVKGDDPDKKGYPGPPGWGFGVGLTTPHSKKLIVTKVKQRNKLGHCSTGQSPQRAVAPVEEQELKDPLNNISDSFSQNITLKSHWS